LQIIGYLLPPAIEIKFKLDNKKSAKATVAIVTVHALSCVSLATDLPQLAAANALATIIVIAIFYGPCPAPKHSV
jgi:hypothetical protein